MSQNCLKTPGEGTESGEQSGVGVSCPQPQCVPGKPQPWCPPSSTGDRSDSAAPTAPTERGTDAAARGLPAQAPAQGSRRWRHQQRRQSVASSQVLHQPGTSPFTLKWALKW